jgi:hypothetical protein
VTAAGARVTQATLARRGLPRRRLRGITAAVRSVETVCGGRNVLTTHGPEAYPGLLVVKPGPRWEVWVIVPEDGQTITARGGEKTYSYETVDGGRARGFELRPGDQATLARSGLPFAMVEWRILRHAPAIPEEGQPAS